MIQEVSAHISYAGALSSTDGKGIEILLRKAATQIDLPFLGFVEPVEGIATRFLTPVVVGATITTLQVEFLRP